MNQIHPTIIHPDSSAKMIPMTKDDPAPNIDNALTDPGNGIDVIAETGDNDITNSNAANEEDPSDDDRSRNNDQNPTNNKPAEQYNNYLPRVHNTDTGENINPPGVREEEVKATKDEDDSAFDNNKETDDVIQEIPGKDKYRPDSMTPQ
uniref:Uncharacterized protein n=1 Tax=Odontella aurita TaxID=265563 RepID=A0A7S4JW30_9STRA|mmetsp:Transcript_5556/g.16135  ORF Transcript_5556/g.16135 Transcript_5556/m.16135 type:complete len:149 (+) Transcript_5556:73-519(+)